MSRRRRSRRGVSLGTVVMLLLTIVVLGGFCALLPRLTGTTDVRTNAAELAAVSYTHLMAPSAAAKLSWPARKAKHLVFSLSSMAPRLPWPRPTAR